MRLPYPVCALAQHPVAAVVAVSVWVTRRARLYGSCMADKR